MKQRRPAYPVKKCRLCKLTLTQSVIGKNRYKCSNKTCPDYTKTFKEAGNG